MRALPTLEVVPPEVEDLLTWLAAERGRSANTLAAYRRDLRRYAAWLQEHLPSGTYRGWVAEADGTVVAGAGLTQLTWPPGPREFSGRLPIVYNVYTEPAHRRRGLARALMETVHVWCRDAGYSVVGLAASTYGRALYESLGYRASPSPYMFLTL